MVVINSLRAFGYAAKGVSGRKAALRELAARPAAAATPSAATLPPSIQLLREHNTKGVSVPLRCWPHTVDALGHVNHARYLEFFEYARWYYLAFADFPPPVGTGPGAAYCVVSQLSIHYMREVKAFAKVHSTASLLPSEYTIPVDQLPLAGAISGTTSSSSPAATAAADAAALVGRDVGGGGVVAAVDSATGVATVRETNRMWFFQQLWDERRRRLHAEAAVQMVYLAHPSYAARLQARYRPQQLSGSDDDKKKGAAPPARRFVPVDICELIADRHDLIDAAPVRDILYESKAAIIADTARVAAGSASAAPARDWLNDITTVNRYWRSGTAKPAKKGSGGAGSSNSSSSK